jgi:reactive chlorine resistance protein C
MNTHAGTPIHMPMAAAGELARSATIETIGSNVLRYALVLVFVLFGTGKFTAAEAAAIKPLVSNSPFMSWMYGVMSDQAVSSVIGIAELVAAALIAIRPFSARAAAIGSAIAVGTFVTTLSFLFTTPGALSPMHPAHGFLLKDIVLLGAAVALGAESIRAAASAAARR